MKKNIILSIILVVLFLNIFSSSEFNMLSENNKEEELMQPKSNAFASTTEIDDATGNIYFHHNRGQTFMQWTWDGYLYRTGGTFPVGVYTLNVRSLTNPANLVLITTGITAGAGTYSFTAEWESQVVCVAAVNQLPFTWTGYSNYYFYETSGTNTYQDTDISCSADLYISASDYGTIAAFVTTDINANLYWHLEPTFTISSTYYHLDNIKMQIYNTLTSSWVDTDPRNPVLSHPQYKLRIYDQNTNQLLYEDTTTQYFMYQRTISFRSIAMINEGSLPCIYRITHQTGSTSTIDLNPSGDVSVAWTPSTPGTHYTLIDEPYASPTTADYIESGASSSVTDEFSFGNVGAGIITNIQVFLYGATTSGTRNVNIKYRLDAAGSYSSQLSTADFTTSAAWQNVQWAVCMGGTQASNFQLWIQADSVDAYIVRVYTMVVRFTVYIGSTTTDYYVSPYSYEYANVLYPTSVIYYNPITNTPYESIVYTTSTSTTLENYEYINSERTPIDLVPCAIKIIDQNSMVCDFSDFQVLVDSVILTNNLFDGIMGSTPTIYIKDPTGVTTWTSYVVSPAINYLAISPRNIIISVKREHIINNFNEPIFITTTDTVPILTDVLVQAHGFEYFYSTDIVGNYVIEDANNIVLVSSTAIPVSGIIIYTSLIYQQSLCSIQIRDQNNNYCDFFDFKVYAGATLLSLPIYYAQRGVSITFYAKDKTGITTWGTTILNPVLTGLNNVIINVLRITIENQWRRDIYVTSSGVIPAIAISVSPYSLIYHYCTDETGTYSIYDTYMGMPCVSGATIPTSTDKIIYANDEDRVQVGGFTLDSGDSGRVNNSIYISHEKYNNYVDYKVAFAFFDFQWIDPAYHYLIYEFIDAGLFTLKYFTYMPCLTMDGDYYISEFIDGWAVKGLEQKSVLPVFLDPNQYSVFGPWVTFRYNNIFYFGEERVSLYDTYSIDGSSNMEFMFMYDNYYLYDYNSQFADFMFYDVYYTLKPTFILNSSYYNDKNIRLEILDNSSNSDWTSQDFNNPCIYNPKYKIKLYDIYTDSLIYEDNDFVNFSVYRSITINSLNFINNSPNVVNFTIASEGISLLVNPLSNSIINITNGNYNVEIFDFYGNSLANISVIESEMLCKYSPDEIRECFISLANQRNDYLNWENYRIYLNGTQIYSNIFDGILSETYNISIYTRFDKYIISTLYTVQREYNYIPITITQFKLKIFNQQEGFVYSNITFDPNYYISSQYWSEWIAPHEIIEYFLSTDYYIVNITEYETNSSFVYSYYLNGDDILLIGSANTIANTIINIQNMNSSIGNQITAVNISISNVSTAVISMTVSINNINTTIGVLSELSAIYTNCLFSSGLNWSTNLTEMYDQFDYYTLTNRYNNETLLIQFRNNNQVINMQIGAQETINQPIKANTDYRVQSVRTGEYLTEWTPLTDKTVDFGIYQAEGVSLRLDTITWIDLLLTGIITVATSIYLYKKAGKKMKLKESTEKKKNVKKNNIFEDETLFNR